MRSIIIGVLIATGFIGCVYADNARQQNETATAQYFQSIKSNPNELRMFLQAMPKGGDLHNHLGGAAYEEDLLNFAASAHECVNPTTEVVYANNNCPTVDLVSTIENNKIAYGKLINAMSMRNYQTNGTPGDIHFFNTFSAFEQSPNYAQLLTMVLPTMGREHIDYVEFIVSPQTASDMADAQHIQWTNNFAQLEKALNKAGMLNIVKNESKKLDQIYAYYKGQLHCSAAQADPGCNVLVRFQYSALRNFQPIDVFAQLLEAFEVSAQDPRVVGVNLVDQENAPTSIRDYTLHMQMIRYLHQQYPQVHISLHAGEMAFGQVPPSYLQNHIDQALNIAGAERIGHGVDIAYENNALQLLQEMAKNHTLVEVNLTSNADILGIVGKQHPILLYMAHHVPIALSPDDPGVLRTDLTHEYQRAVKTYGFDYKMLKNIDRNSLIYAFLPGKSLWENNDTFVPISACQQDIIGGATPSKTCQQFLNANQKAQMQWRLEFQFNQFEAIKWALSI